MTKQPFASKDEYTDFLRFLDQLCNEASYKVTRGEKERLEFAFSSLDTSIGPVDVFRYQSEENWDSDEPYSCQLGQGMFNYDGTTVEVNDRCDSGWKYYLPNPEPQVYGGDNDIPSLQELVEMVRKARDVSSSYEWKGP